jgi:hypothetical protein
VGVHLLLLATSEAAQPHSRSARPPQSRSAEPYIAKDAKSSSCHDSSSSSSWCSNSRAHTRFNRIRLRKDFDNVGPRGCHTTHEGRTTQGEQRSHAQDQVASYSKPTCCFSLFCFVDFEYTLRSNSSKPTFVCTPGRNKSDSKANQLPIRLNIFTRQWPCGENQEDICNAAANKGEI